MLRTLSILGLLLSTVTCQENSGDTGSDADGGTSGSGSGGRSSAGRGGSSTAGSSVTAGTDSSGVGGTETGGGSGGASAGDTSEPGGQGGAPDSSGSGGTAGTGDPLDTDKFTQILRGSIVFDDECARCHGAAGQGIGGVAPRITGGGALLLDPPAGSQVRTGQFVTAFDVLDFVRTEEPPDAPGTLAAQEYLNVVAFILAANDVLFDQPITEENAPDIIVNQPR